LKKTVIWVTGLALLSGLTLLAVAVRRHEWYTPGSDFGYYLGLAGGIMMLVLLTYPLRKRIRIFQRFGPLKPWFRFHMFLGIAGPLAIVFHSTFKWDTANAFVAMMSMLLVAGSGVIGRYIYVRLHDGLYGHQLTLDELQGDEGEQSKGIHRTFAWAPDVVDLLSAFRSEALAPSTGFGHGFTRFVALPAKSWRMRRTAARHLRAHLTARAVARQWTDEKLQRRERQFKTLIADYCKSVRNAAQYGAYTRIFSWWHILHIPLVYLLAATAAYHVLAVHMY
jgi:hypothetical protein